ncbi:cation:proton antiporter domain-containing protein [Coxiella endosymbiont of Amblyomma nuttalli]|uniref:cation:proton antiporter domain-containing protein n=1 Tax=Coxiella endosymbiont of Amblyomma nuttalli TaxID=2749996 RepID=UPI001BAC6C60|nr:cation:proton antiporter [Coxiella endosymbiont of Amblyomma nuttalli]QTS83988.1 Glutathione-regulated potassium-efflux system protein KefC [Coxiella endosymbiont of Amblyomma nuttalli]
MLEHNLIFSIFLIFTGAAILSTFALMTRQSMLVAYILLGIFFGPWGLRLINNLGMLRTVGDVGIIFLLFLLGLNLPPQKLITMFKEIKWVGLISSVVFATIGYLVAYFFNYPWIECLTVGSAMMFSSTIIGIKLLPTTILHHQHTGEVMISVLLLQDLIAIAVLFLLHGMGRGGRVLIDVILLILGFPAILIFAYLFDRFALFPLFSKFNRIKEYLFLLAIGWCLSMTELAAVLGLSAEIGAFIAGVSLASRPVSVYISESLKPVRDFFLVLFFFSVGATFNLKFLSDVIIPSLILLMLLMITKPVIYRVLLQWMGGESKQVAWEVGIRLAQISEFSLIIAYVASANYLISNKAANLIEAATILSFIASSYWVVIQYPTPVAMSDRLRRD